MDTDGGEVYMSLSDLFVDEQVPFYEVNAWTTDVLRRLMEINRERDNHGRQLLEDVRQKTKEYQAEASHMQEVLEESLGLTTNSLSSSGSSLLNSLVDCSLALDLKDTSRTSFVLAMNSLTSELTAAESRAQELEVKALSKKLTDKMVLEQLLEEAMNCFAEMQRQTEERFRMWMEKLTRMDTDEDAKQPLEGQEAKGPARVPPPPTQPGSLLPASPQQPHSPYGNNHPNADSTQAFQTPFNNNNPPAGFQDNGNASDHDLNRSNL
uniref:Arkadia (RNF111) N-terminal like PKA signaling regulator 2N n=1 Tax=Callorhinchus milii TaxID=7868 RepID=A0A4W3HX46_CALMI